MDSKKLLFLSLLLILSLHSVSASPLIVAHRAGTADYPENTMHAISMAIKNHADVIWLTVQLTNDHIPVIYRPNDLNSLTNGDGLVSSYSLLEIKMVDAAYYFKTNDQYLYRGRGLKIPSLNDIFVHFPNTKFILDIKSPDADPKVMANTLATLINTHNIADNIMIYSTERKYLNALPDHITRFEPRDLTRKILANAIMANECHNPINKKPTTANNIYHAFELVRDVKVIENFTLGKGRSRAKLIWNPQAMACFKRNSATKVLLIGINSHEDYLKASNLGADYVMVDSPATAQHWR